MILSFTRPSQRAHMGTPFFRTRKELGNRAVVTDSFSKTSRDRSGWKDALGGRYVLPADLTETKAHPGMGIVAHREGYNVLYGDGHAQWYGDPQQGIVWHGQGMGSSSYPSPQPQYTTYDFGLLANQFWNSGGLGPIAWHYGQWPDSGSNPATAMAGQPCWEYSSARIWHDFDVSARVDVFE